MLSKRTKFYLEQVKRRNISKEWIERAIAHVKDEPSGIEKLREALALKLEKSLHELEAKMVKEGSTKRLKEKRSALITTILNLKQGEEVTIKGVPIPLPK